MTLPNLPLPTDNLYKFMAITGLLGIVLIVYYHENTQATLKKDINTQTLELKLLSADTMLLNLKRSDVNQRLLSFATFMMDDFPNEVKNRDLANNIISEKKLEFDSISALNWMYYLVLKHPQYMPLLNQLIQSNTEYKESAHQSLRAIEEFGIKNTYLDQAIQKYELNKRILRWLLFSSICLTILGFGLWYFRVQIYQDQFLKNSVDLPKKKGKKKATFPQ